MNSKKMFFKNFLQKNDANIKQKENESQSCN